VDRLHAELCAIIEAAQRKGIGLVAVGAFAVRAHLVEPDRRRTNDIDLVVESAAQNEFRQLLEDRGYRVYETNPWWRAELDAATGRTLIDFGLDAVVDMASFESYALDTREAQRRAEPGRSAIPVPALEHVVAMKLLAHRDKDLLDLVALLRDAGDRLDAAALRANIEARDLEIAVRRGYLSLQAAAESGQLAQLWTERLGRPLLDETLAKALEQLHNIFG
jgi:hypothetical protein